MFESTALVAKMDSFGHSYARPMLPNVVASEPTSTVRATKMGPEDTKMVPLDSVIRSAASIVTAVSILSLAATFLTGAIIIQPIFAVMLLVASVGFQLMTLVK